MKRADLLNIPVIPLTKIKKEQKETWLLVEAQTTEIDNVKVLALDLYETDKMLLCRHFVTEESYYTIFRKKITFEYSKIHNAGEWYTGKYETILKKGEVYYGYMNGKAAYSKQAKKAIENFGEGYSYARSDVNYMISEKEDDIARKKAMTAAERKKERIQELMQGVTPMDEPFRDWIKENVFQERYLFAETRALKRGYRCRCTTCQKTYFLQEKPKHNETTECKKCHTAVIVKTRTSDVTERKNILVAQSYNETTWVLRHFKAQMNQNIMFKKANISLAVYERFRMFMTKAGTEKIYYGAFYDAGGNEQIWETEKHGKVIDKSFYFYPGRIEELTAKHIDTGLLRTLQHIADLKIEMNTNELIRRWWNSSYLEYLIKGKFYRMTNETLSYWVLSELVDYEADTIHGFLKLDKQRSYRLRDLNGGKHALEILQEEKATGNKVSQENLEYVNKNKIPIKNLRYIHDRTGLTVNQILNYYRRQCEKNRQSYEQFNNFYKDYLDMAEEQRMNLTDDIVRRNPNMMEYHNRYAEEKNKAADEKKIAEARNKYPDIEKDYEINCKRFAWENEDYSILVPRHAGDIVMEGRLQHHCVGGDNYLSSMNNRKSYILFLRRKEQLDIPYYTIEVEDNKIHQRYAAYNREPDAQEVDKVLKKWMREVKKRETEIIITIEAPAETPTRQRIRPVELAVAAGQ